MTALSAKISNAPITVTTSPLTITSFQSTTISYTLTDVINGATTIVAKDSADNSVWDKHIAMQSTGSFTDTWNGRYNNGTPVPPGYYNIIVSHIAIVPDLTIPVGGEFDSPDGIPLDAGGNIYAADTVNAITQVFYPEAKTSTPIYVDLSAPVTTVVTSQGIYNDGTYDRGIWLSLAASDTGSGVNDTLWSIDGENWTLYTGPMTYNQDGTYTIWYWSIDKVGNEEQDRSTTFTVKDHSGHPLTINYVFDPANRQATPTGTVAPNPTAVPTEKPATNVTPDQTVTPTQVPTPTQTSSPTPNQADSGLPQGTWIWIALLCLVIVALVAGGYFLSFRK